MKKFLPPVFLFVLIGLVLFSWLSRIDRNEYTAELAMESDAMAIVKYYYPKQVILTNTPDEAKLVLPEFKSPQPVFGTLVLGNSSDSLITLALDESLKDGFSYLYIDKNNNEDLTDDSDPFWDEDKKEYWSKEELIDIYYKDSNSRAAVPYPVKFYRYKIRHQNSIVAFRNGYREGFISLKDTAYKMAIIDDDLNGLFNVSEKGAIIIDINGDGILNGHPDSPEYFLLTSPFNVNGITYRTKNISPAGDVITLVISDSVVMPKVALESGVEAPLFRTTSVADETIDLNGYKNKVVLLDFWATWCKPWENERTYLQRIYNRYQSRGFEIIGLNLDSNPAVLLDYLKTNKINWPQVSDGRGWDMSVVELYQVQAVPKNYLLDRKGIIRYKDLHGVNLRNKIDELLNEPEDQTRL